MLGVARAQPEHLGEVLAASCVLEGVLEDL